MNYVLFSSVVLAMIDNQVIFTVFTLQLKQLINRQVF